MQGQRSAISSLPEALDIDHPSSSSSASNGMNSHQLCWNTMQSSSESQISRSMVLPSDQMAFLTSVSHEQQNLQGSGMPEHGSSSSYHEVGSSEWKAEHGWLSSVGFSGGSGPLIEDQQRSANNRRFLLNDVSVNPLMIQNSRASWIGQNLNLNAGHGSESSFSECPSLYSLTGLNDQQLPPAGCSDPFMIPPGNGKCIVGENDGGQGGSLDVRHIPCKRKSLEGHVGQSSIGESSRFLEVEETGAQHAISAHSNMSTNLTRSHVSEQADPHRGSRVGVSESAETSQRSSRLRINSSMLNYPNSSIIHPMGGALSNSNVLSTSQSSRYVSVDHSLDLPFAPASSNVNVQDQPDLPSLPYPEQSVRWSRGSITRPGTSSSSAFSRSRDDELQEANLGRYLRNIGGRHMYIPASELRTLVQAPVTRDIPGGSSAIPRSTTLSTQAGSSTSLPQSSQPNSVPHRGRHSQFPRGSSEYVRRSLLASIGSETDHNSHSSDVLGHPAFSQEAVLSSGSRNHSHRRSFPGSAPWMERHGDALGIPYSMRTLAAASEGRRRLVSEIRSVLDHMRQGEGSRLEDVMILDQSVFLGVADIHDRHGDMRLDVDNMSYEELLALEERIGNVSTGLSEETILSRMKQSKYAVVVRMDVEAEPCCICQELYNEGDGVGTLECGHDFHTDCIKQWLMHKNLCPICKTTGLTM